MNFYIAIAGFIVAWCVIMSAIDLFMRAWERRQERVVEPFDGFYLGCHRSLLAELEKELP